MQHINLVRNSVILTALFVLIGCGPTPSPDCACDLTVTNLEVTQGIQTTTNTIQLVAQRSTAVRATLGVSGTGGSVSGVTGQLHVFVGGVEITPAAGVAPINAPFTAPLAPQRANENDTLNFELEAPTGITASPNVTFRVDITPLSGETNTSNNSLTTGSLTVINRTTPTIFFTRINYTPSGLGLPDPALVAAGAGDAFVRGIFPVNDGDPNLYRQGLFPTLPFSEDADGNGRLDVFALEGNNLLSLLASCRQLIVDNGLGAANNTILYGWIAGPVDGNGLSTLNGRNAFGNTEANRGQRTFAHELGHLFGRSHPATDVTLDQVGWDVGGRLANNWAGNGVTGRVRPMTLFDIMVPAKITNQAWVDTITYNALLGSPILASIGPDRASNGVLMLPAIQEEKPTERVAVIQGIFDAKGQELLRLEPVFRFPWPSQPVVRQTGIYLVEVTDDAGTVTTAQFDALLSEDSEEGKMIYGFFEVMVPVAPDREIVSVRITDATGERVFGELKRSEPPEIVIVAPESGAQLGEETEIAWEVQDPDTPREELSYQVAYSPDGGRSWVPIAVDVPGTEKGITFNSTEIQQSQGEGMLRVFVSDGLNTAFADASKLTTIAAKY